MFEEKVSSKHAKLRDNPVRRRGSLSLERFKTRLYKTKYSYEEFCLTTL